MGRHSVVGITANISNWPQVDVQTFATSQNLCSQTVGRTDENLKNLLKYAERVQPITMANNGHKCALSSSHLHSVWQLNKRPSDGTKIYEAARCDRWPHPKGPPPNPERCCITLFVSNFNKFARHLWPFVQIFNLFSASTAFGPAHIMLFRFCCIVLLWLCGCVLFVLTFAAKKAN